MINLALLLIFILLILIIYKGLRKNSSTPKGLKELPYEKGLPIIGIMHQIKIPLCIHLSNLGKKHGPLYRIKLGMRDVVVLNNYDIIKKTLKDDGDNFAGRFNTKYFKEITRNVGLIWSDGEVWAKQRTFILNVFREFGVNTSRYVDIIQEECTSLLGKIEQMNEMPLDFSTYITPIVANVISKFLTNKRLDMECQHIRDFNELTLGIGKSKDIFQLLSLMFPCLDNSRLFFRFITLVSPEWKLFEKIHDYYKEEIKEHLEKLDFNSEGEDLIDRFLIKQRGMKTKTGNVDSFTEWQLIRNIVELFMAGYETLSTTLGWSLFFMSKYPEIQSKVYSEIMDKIGDKEPSMNDKVHLVYTQAVMDEIFRMSSVGPLALIHQTYKDCIVDGYFIPKRSIIFPNLYACHHDLKTWEKPMEFNPGHFLSDDDDTGELKYTSREDLIPFGIGKRQCIGESLARMEYFIFFTRIMQRFKVNFCKDVSEKKYEEILVANEGIVRQCSIKTFNFTNRK